MVDLASDAPPAGLRWTQEGPTEGTVNGFHRSWSAFHAFGLVWNAGHAVSVFTRANDPSPMLALGLAATALFLVLLLRSLFIRTRLRFAGGTFEVRSTLLGGRALSVPVAALRTFRAQKNPDRGENEVVAVLDASEIPVPVDVDPFVLVWRGSRRQAWTFAPDRTEWIARRLTEMLEHARRAHGTYRG